MPVEGLETTTDTTSQTTSDETGKTTEAKDTGAETQTATTEAQTDITQTPEFKAALTAAVERKVPQLKRALARELTGEKEGSASVEDLQRQLSERDTKIRSFEARETVEAFLTDGRNKLNVKPENVRGIQAIVIPQLEYDDDGKPSNLKDAIENAKVIAPALFANTPVPINANQGRTGQAPGFDMNSIIRQAAGHG